MFDPLLCKIARMSTRWISPWFPRRRGLLFLSEFAILSRTGRTEMRNFVCNVLNHKLDFVLSADKMQAKFDISTHTKRTAGNTHNVAYRYTKLTREHTFFVAGQALMMMNVWIRASPATRLQHAVWRSRFHPISNNRTRKWVTIVERTKKWIFPASADQMPMRKRKSSTNSNSNLVTHQTLSETAPKTQGDQNLKFSKYRNSGPNIYKFF